MLVIYSFDIGILKHISDPTRPAVDNIGPFPVKQRQGFLCATCVPIHIPPKCHSLELEFSYDELKSTGKL